MTTNEERPEWVEAALRGRAERSEKLRQFYKEHPASEIPPHPKPKAGDWHKVEVHRVQTEQAQAALRLLGTEEQGELQLQTSLDPCQTWSALLSRTVRIGHLDETEVHAVFLARVTGAKDRLMAEQAVIAAGQVAGWIEEEVK